MQATAPFSLTVLTAGPSQPHAGWTAVDELASLLASYFDAPVISPRPVAPPAWRRALRRSRPCFAPAEAAPGDVLFVVARSPEDLHMIEAIPQVHRRFARIQAFIADSYHYEGFPKWAGTLDKLTATAREDVAHLRSRGIDAQHVYQGTDALRWAPRRERSRDIDLIAYGRTPASFHREFQRRFHADGSPHLYLHSPIGSLAGPTVLQERGMLFKLLHRTNISLAFHMFVEPQGDRPRSMMVTSRWLESLVAGCIVAGQRPASSMADEMLNWAGSTVELPDAPADAADALHEMLSCGEEIVEQRRSNVCNVLHQHDWRHRIVQLCGVMGWPVPDALSCDLQRLADLAGRWSQPTQEVTTS